MSYFKNISEGIGTTLKGMQLTWRHLWQARRRRMSTDIRSGNFFDMQDGMVTVQYPQETIPIPDNGRYRLHNEMDDCIVCDKCVKVCPVDCIEIEPIRAIEEVGRASDGSPIRLYAAKFDIDMAKCCYCGLCTTVCPTECLTMTKTFDYSEFDVRDMVYNYANLSAEEADEKRRLLEQFQKEKEALKAAQRPVTASEPTPAVQAARPVFKPTIKPKPQQPEETAAVPAKPAFVPRKPVSEKNESEKAVPEDQKEKPKLPFRPSMKPKADAAASPDHTDSETPAEAAPAKPAFRPTMKPKLAETAKPEETAPETPAQAAPARPAFRPTMKPKTAETAKPEVTAPETPAQAAPAKPAFRPTMKPKPAVQAENSEEKKADMPVPAQSSEQLTENKTEEQEAVPKPKPAFRPTMKPKPKGE